MTDYFHPSKPVIQPYALMDLDDTLFQTRRKIEDWQLPQNDLSVATVNKQGEPLSFFTAKQASFFNWLLHSTELIVVTARDRQEIKRVRLPFYSWQVLTHGALITQPDGQPLPEWQQYMVEQLQPYQVILANMLAYLSEFDRPKIWAVTPHEDDFIDNGLMIYLAVKHQHKDHAALTALAKQLSSHFPDFSQYFYLHINANNLAILPYPVHKRYAVAFLQQHHLDPARACFGFGDSLADLPFLQLLDWYGTPNRGQLHTAITQGVL